MAKIKIKEPVLIASLVIAALTTLIVVLVQKKLPPQVPLLYGAAEGESQLVNSWALLVPSLFSVLAIIVNGAISSLTKDEFIRKILIFSALVVTLFSIVTTFKIILLVGSF